jgi:predicted dehydrogenase
MNRANLLQTNADCSRRGFLQRAAGLGAAAVGVPCFVPGTALGADGNTAANERIGMAFIGTGNQGTGDMGGFLGDRRVQVLAVCDVNRESPGYWDGSVRGREPARRMVDQHYAAERASGAYRGCAAYVDFREVLDRDDIDAVEVATPDHWHAILVVAACRAGKDIYCQKPLSLTIAEGRAMADAVQRYGVVLQTGSQQRSDPNFRRACELVRNGRIGELQTVECGLPGGRPDYGKTGDRKQPEPVPEGFDYDFWLGPAPLAPYCPARCHVNFRWVLDYSGGQLTDWGGHHPDCAQWGMGTERTGPIEIRAARGSFPPDPVWDTATDYYFEAIYRNGVKMIVSNRVRGGVTWKGTEGTVWANRGRHDAEPKSILSSEIGPDEIHLYQSDNHFRNFIDCVLSRKEPIAPAEVAHRSITICHLGNIAMRLGIDSLKWDPDKEEIVDDPIASRMLSRPYRGPWSLGG